MRLNAIWLILGTSAIVAACGTAEPATLTTIESPAEPSTLAEPHVSTSAEVPTDLGGTTTIPELDGPTETGCPPGAICILPGGATFDERWVATVTLDCGSTASTRTLVEFDAETADYGEPTLSVGEQHADGSSRFIQWPLVGDEIDVEGTQLFWNIQNVLLGPWEVNEIIDACSDSP